MGERWVSYYLDGDENLRCTSCHKCLHNQKVYLYMDVNDGLDEVMCDTCWKKDQKEINK